MEVQNQEITKVPVCLDNNQQVIAMFTIPTKHEPAFGALCRELGGLPTIDEAEEWLAKIENR